MAGLCRVARRHRMPSVPRPTALGCKTQDVREATMADTSHDILVVGRSQPGVTVGSEPSPSREASARHHDRRPPRRRGSRRSAWSASRGRSPFAERVAAHRRRAGARQRRADRGTQPLRSTKRERSRRSPFGTLGAEVAGSSYRASIVLDSQNIGSLPVRAQSRRGVQQLFAPPCRFPRDDPCKILRKDAKALDTQPARCPVQVPGHHRGSRLLLTADHLRRKDRARQVETPVVHARTPATF